MKTRTICHFLIFGWMLALSSTCIAQSFQGDYISQAKAEMNGVVTPWQTHQIMYTVKKAQYPHTDAEVISRTFSRFRQSGDPFIIQVRNFRGNYETSFDVGGTFRFPLHPSIPSFMTIDFPSDTPYFSDPHIQWNECGVHAEGMKHCTFNLNFDVFESYLGVDFSGRHRFTIYFADGSSEIIDIIIRLETKR